MVGAVVIRQNLLMRRFEEAGATGPDSARTLSEMACRRSFVFQRMVARGVFVETDGNRFYMDEAAAHAFVRMRRRTALIFLGIAILLFALLQLFT